MACTLRVYPLLPVHVEGNTQGSLKNKPGGTVPESWRPYLVRAAPFDTLEVLSEGETLPLTAGRLSGVIVEADISAEARPGVYEGRLVLTTDAQSASVAFRVQVHKTVLASHFPLHCVHWLWPEPCNLTHTRVPDWWSDRHWRLVENSLRQLRRFGDDTVYTPLINYREPLIQTFRTPANHYVFDYSRFDRWVSLALRLGFRLIAGHHILNLPQSYMGGVYVRDSRRGTVEPLLPAAKDHDAWLAFLPTFYRSFHAHLQARGWLKRYVQHQYDEPKKAELYQRLSALTRAGLPGVRTIDAINSSRQDLFSPLVDIQVFNLLGLHKYQRIAAERHRQGKAVWLYHCTSPYPPYPNRHLDSRLTECRVYPWLCFKLKADGFLYWGANIYRGADEYRTSLGPFPNGSQNPGHPPGDNWQYYRGPDGLRPSMRLVSFREGLVDHALVTMLARRDPQAAAALVNQLVPSLKTFRRAPEAYHAARAQLLARLDAY